MVRFCKIWTVISVTALTMFSISLLCPVHPVRKGLAYWWMFDVLPYHASVEVPIETLISTAVSPEISTTPLPRVDKRVFVDLDTSPADLMRLIYPHKNEIRVGPILWHDTSDSEVLLYITSRSKDQEDAPQIVTEARLKGLLRVGNR